jgi:hypothetical protein
MHKYTTALLCIVLIFSSVACKKSSSTSTPVYDVPTSYTFASVNYSNQLILIAMADQLVAAINTANTIPGTAVSAQVLTGMFTNTGSYFNDSALQLNSSGLRLSDCFPQTAKADLLNYLDSVGVYSQSGVTAAPGVAGVAASVANANKKYLLSPNGVFYSQVVKKAIMGAFAYQIAGIYMADSINSTTDTVRLAHYWDAAFGFFGVPVNFPTSTTGLKYFGSYSNQVNAGLGSNASIMNAFLKGRAAIGAGDLSTMKTQATLLISLFDTLNAACVVQEMHETNTNIEAGDAVAAYGTLSESLGFVRNFSYNTGKRVITAAQYNQLLALYDGGNLYTFVGASVNTNAQIEAKTNAIQQLIGQIYGFDATELSGL